MLLKENLKNSYLNFSKSQMKEPQKTYERSCSCQMKLGAQKLICFDVEMNSLEENLFWATNDLRLRKERSQTYIQRYNRMVEVQLRCFFLGSDQVQISFQLRICGKT